MNPWLWKQHWRSKIICWQHWCKKRMYALYAYPHYCFHVFHGLLKFAGQCVFFCLTFRGDAVSRPSHSILLFTIASTFVIKMLSCTSDSSARLIGWDSEHYSTICRCFSKSAPLSYCHGGWILVSVTIVGFSIFDFLNNIAYFIFVFVFLFFFFFLLSRHQCRRCEGSFHKE